MTVQPSDTDRVHEAQRLVLELADEQDIKVVFHKAKRRTDITMFSLRGERSAVLSMPGAVMDHLEGVDLELLRSDQQGATLLVTMVITRQLASQDIQFTERRTKLRMLAQQVREVLTQRVSTN